MWVLFGINAGHPHLGAAKCWTSPVTQTSLMFLILCSWITDKPDEWVWNIQFLPECPATLKATIVNIRLILLWNLMGDVSICEHLALSISAVWCPISLQMCHTCREGIIILNNTYKISLWLMHPMLRGGHTPVSLSWMEFFFLSLNVH